MDRKVAIVASRQTRHCAESPLSREHMIYELVKGLHTEAGIAREDIDTIVQSSNDFHDGRTISNVYLAAPIGAYMKDETKVESDGMNALLYAWMRILSGSYSTALVVGYSLGGSEFRPYLAAGYMLDPIYERQLGLTNEVSAAAFQARAYMLKYGLTERQLAKIAAKNLRLAAKNPHAMRTDHPTASAEDVLASPALYSPLCELHCYPFTDGACAVLLAEEKTARRLTTKPVWIQGFGSCQESYYLGERDLAVSESTRAAALRAYGMAGIKDPAKEIHVAEIHAPFASQEPILAEALGLFEEGSGGRVIDCGESDLGGRVPVNPSGGPLGAHPVYATGLIRAAEVARQLRGEADEAQIPGARVGVAHGQDGICAQSSTVVVLSIEPQAAPWKQTADGKRPVVAKEPSLPKKLTAERKPADKKSDVPKKQRVARNKPARAEKKLVKTRPGAGRKRMAPKKRSEKTKAQAKKKPTPKKRLLEKKKAVPSKKPFARKTIGAKKTAATTKRSGGRRR